MLYNIKCKLCGVVTQKRQKNGCFCSNSCSSKYSNIHHKERYTKRNKKIKCKHCSNIFLRKKRPGKQLCEDCSSNRFVFQKNPTKKELIHTYKHLHRSSAYSYIRSHARRTIKNEKTELKCSKCCYNKHVEVCHVKSISSFKDSDRLSDINNIKNLLLLCPNHHWEFDNLR
jgi:hypothetical protein